MREARNDAPPAEASEEATVAVVVPARNAASLLPACIAAIRAQQRPADELWIVVGPSTDGTLEAARELADDHTAVLVNPPGDRASALNLVLARTTADFVAFVDAQSLLDAAYLSVSLTVASATGAAVVGGPMRPRGRTGIGEALAGALQSSFGIGNSQFHFEGGARDVDSVYLGVYKNTVFREVGRYNEALLRTEDDDLNARIRIAGHRIHLDPRIRSTYLCRSTMVDVWRQFAGYGYWKVALATIRPQAIRMRHLVPASFVVGGVASAVVSLSTRTALFPVVAAGYLCVGLFVGARIEGLTIRARLLFPVVTLVMHGGYGFGSLHGLLRWRALKRAAAGGAVRAVSTAPSSRRERGDS